MRTLRSLGVGLLLGFVALGAHASEALSLSELQDLKPRTARAIEGDAARALREATVREAALAAGVSAAYADRSRELREKLVTLGPQFDVSYNFTPLLDNGRLLVPSVELVREVSAIEADGSQLRETGRVLRIIEPARLVTAPPTWRDYLSAWRDSDQQPDRPSDDALPTNARERSVWSEGLAEGWEMGRRQADAVFRSELATLTESYLGRIRYRMLVEQRIVKPATLGQTDFGIVAESDVVRVEDALFSVRQAAAFASPSEWRALPRPGIPASPRVRVLTEETLR